MPSSKNEQEIKVNSMSGEPLATICAPADGLTLSVIKKVLGGSEYRKFPEQFIHPMTIIDIGANVGASAIFFSLKYPNAKIFGFEPFPDILNYLSNNTKDFPNITVFPFGLLSKDCREDFYPGIQSSVESSTIPHGGTKDKPVEACFRKASAIFQELNISQISILKIDTEGAEIEILNDIESWFPKIELLFIEFHSEEDRLTIDKLLSPLFILYDFSMDCVHRGLMTYLSKKSASKIPDIHSSRIRRR